MKIKKGWIYVLLILTMVMFYFILKDEFSEIMQLLFSLDLRYIFLAISVVISYFLIDALKLKAFVDATNKKVSFRKLLENVGITTFFSAVTPFSTGGQPVQIYLLTKEGYKGEEATGISIQNFICYEIVFVVFGIFALMYGAIFKVFEGVQFFNLFTIFGFSIHLGLLIFFILVTIKPKLTIKIVKIFFKLMKRLNLMKNINKKKAKAIKKIKGFHDHIEKFRKNKKLNMELIVLNSMKLILYYSVPIFLLYSLGVFDFNVISIMVAIMLVTFVASFIPVPGASGGMEFGFIQFVGVFLISSTLSAVLLLWRLMTYYIPLFIGMLVLWLSDYNKDKKERILVNEDIC